MIPGWQMEAYERLRTAVVKSAVSELRKAIRKSNRIGSVCAEQKKLESWFLSPWGQMLSGDNGDFIIEKCHQTYTQKAHGNGKWQLPDEVQKSLYEDYRRGMPRRELVKKYGISYNQYEYVLRRWRDEVR